MSEKNEPLENLERERSENAEELETARREPQTPWERIKTAVRQGRRTSQAAKSPARREMGKDRTKSLVLLAGAAIGLVLMFLGVFSTPQKPQKAQSRRVTPNLGRRATPGQSAPGTQSGSVTPVMDATGVSGNDEESGGDQLTAADIGRTGRAVQSKSITPRMAKGSRALGTIDFSDPALQRQYAMHGYVPAPPPPAPMPPAPETKETSNDFKKASLVFVRSAERSQFGAVRPPTIDRENTIADGLPTGTRLVARLESPVSSAVVAPAVAVIEYNYERDGEIVVPAGARALGKLQQANRSGHVSLHFDALEMSDGTTETIEASAMGLDYKPLKGDVTGRKRGARFLVQSLTGLGTMATYLVGNNNSSFNAPFSSSALLRERLAGNVAIAGQNELNELALNQNVVVTLPGGTRFYLVLQKGTTLEASTTADRRSSAGSPAPDNSVPSLQELRQLLDLKRELSQMYEQDGTPTGNTPQP